MNIQIAYSIKQMEMFTYRLLELNKLENAKEKLIDIFIKCPDEHPVSISTTLDFSGYCSNDYGNQLLYCDIALAIGVDVKSCSDFPQGNKALPEDPEEKVLKKNVLSFISLLIGAMYIAPLI